METKYKVIYQVNDDNDQSSNLSEHDLKNYYDEIFDMDKGRIHFGSDSPFHPFPNECYPEGYLREIWLDAATGKLHREDAPAAIVRSTTGQVRSEAWSINGKPHREDGPAILEYDDDGSIYYEEWRLNGLLHREGGPAISLYSNGVCEMENWYLNDKAHRLDGPAEIYRDVKTGNMQSEAWYKDHELVDPPYPVWDRVTGMEIKTDNAPPAHAGYSKPVPPNP